MTEAHDPSPDVSLNRLRRTGRWLRKACTLLLALNIGTLALLALLILVTEASQHLLQLHVVGADSICRGAKCVHASPEMIAFNSALSSYKAAWYFGVLIFRGLPPVFILWRLRALGGLFEDGVVFSRDSVRHVEWIGSWMVFWAGVPTLAHLLMTLGGIDMHGYFKRWTDSGQIVLGLIGVGVLMGAQVMQVGRHVEEDRSQFV